MAVDAQMWANLIAGLAFLVSLIAAFFSWRAAAQAKRANDIAVHQYQKELHQAFSEVRALLVSRGWLLQKDELRPYGVTLKSSSLYLSIELSGMLQDFYDLCFQIGDLHHILDAERHSSRILASDPGSIESVDLEWLRTQTDAAVLVSRKNLMECLEVANDLAVAIEGQLTKEIKLR